ncbi:MAG: 2-oxo acid dehydrogenase subunit E2 [Actinobacteria bacterium]|nr:2-oxo acid dehydrogenase subunit E2 [Actinomycetota bacterium]
MPYRFHLPDIGEGLEEAEIVEWLVAPGDTVVRDQALVEVLTDKASSELPSPVAGVIVALGGGEGDRLRVGDLLIEIEDGTPAAVPDPVAAPSEPATVPDPVSTPSEPATVPHPVAAPSEPATLEPAVRPPASGGPPPAVRPKASPATRKRARELGIDLATVRGTGPGGRIVESDLQASVVAAVAPTAGRADDPVRAGDTNRAGDTTRDRATGLGRIAAGRHPLRGVRGVIARNMAQSWSQIPHIHSFDELDASLLLDLRTRMTAIGREVTPLAVAVVSSARALRRLPLVNACVEGDEIVVHDRVNVGVAVATDQGLVVPVLRDADLLDLFGATAEIADLAERARAGRLTAADLTGGTFTVTNYGSLGGRWATPIIPPGQAAILGIGRIADRPAVHEGAVVPRPMLPYSFGADHRLVDGDLLETLKASVVDDLTEPLRLLVGA